MFHSATPFRRFPNLDELTLKYSGDSFERLFNSLFNQPSSVANQLRCLRVVDDNEPLDRGLPQWIKWKFMLGRYPRLRHLELPRIVFSSPMSDKEVEIMEKLEHVLAQRQCEDGPGYEDGVFFPSYNHVADPPWYQTVYRHSLTTEHWTAFR
jgi:hypothetical protein